MLPEKKRHVESSSKSSEIKEAIEFDYQPMDYGLWLARGTGYGGAKRPTKTITALRNLKRKKSKGKEKKSANK